MSVGVIVAGGGPVGLGVATMAARAGFSTVLVEPRGHPVDKACGEGLMPGALAAVRALGGDPVGRDFVGIRYVAGDRDVSARFRAGPGRGVRRTELVRSLAVAADAAGVERVAGSVCDVRQRDGWVSVGGAVSRRASWLIAADGLHSPIRKELGLAAPSRGTPRFGLRRHFAAQPWSAFVEVHWSAAAEAYVTPIDDGTVGLAVLTAVRGRTYDSWLEDFPDLCARLAGAAPVSDVRGAGPLEQVTTRRVAGRVLLVGDAAGYVDALTGEGIAVGLAAARVLVDCLVAGRPADYEAAWRLVSRRYRVLTRGVLVAAQKPRARTLIVPAAAALPSVFARAVNALAG